MELAVRLILPLEILIIAIKIVENGAKLMRFRSNHA